MTKTVWCDRRLLISPIYYGLCLTEKAFEAELKRLNLEPRDWPRFTLTPQADATAHHFEKPDGSCCIIVCLSGTKGRSLEQIYGLLVHEGVHIWQAIREHIGESRPGAEQEAYSIQCIAQELMQAYREQTAKPKKKARAR